jgi:hypothetical protein
MTAAMQNTLNRESTIDFAPERWAGIKETYRKFWAHELKRPIIQMAFEGREPGRPEPELPFNRFSSWYSLDVPPEEIIDRWDYYLSRVEFYGDAFPNMWLNFGPGVLAAFLGSELHAAESTTWFSPKEKLEVGEYNFQLDKNNVWLKRVIDLAEAAGKFWQGNVQVGTTDLGGTLDVLSTFRPSEDLLLDLYDYPEEVKRQTWALHEPWFQAYDLIQQSLGKYNPGYTCWTPIFSEEPYYMLQCDFCYMIGTDMFDEFVKPELAAACKRVKNAFYHLDGPGALPHLDSLLEIEELAGVQWVFGAGNGCIQDWLDVYERIHKAGKLLQVAGPGASDPGKDSYRALDAVADRLGTAEGIYYTCNWQPTENKDKVLRFLEDYGAL